MIICIVGPTGVGKTKLSIELAKKLNGEIYIKDVCYLGVSPKASQEGLVIMLLKVFILCLKIPRRENRVSSVETPNN